MSRVALLVLVLSACRGLIGIDEPSTDGGGGSGGVAGGLGGGASAGGEGGSTGGGSGGGVDASDGGVLTTAEVFARLTPTCAGCHTVTARPYFESLTSFENLIVYDTRWVVPGSPSSSALLQLLDGSVGAMPPAPSLPFAQLADSGLTQVSMAQLRQWITALRPRAAVVIDNPHVRRKSADQMLRALKTQLGLVDADLYTDFLNMTALPGTNPERYPKDADGYAVRSPDLVPPNADEAAALTGLYVALGGPAHLSATQQNDLITQSYALVITHLSQAWCRTAIRKPGNTAIFSQATLADVSTTPLGMQHIKANIAEMYFKMLGGQPSPADVDEVFQVFAAYERKGAETAWTGVCAALIRDPLWLLY